MITIDQATDSEDPPLSTWWVCSVLIAIIVLACRNEPPIPARVLGADGATLFTGSDIGSGQAVFLKYGLMGDGSIRAHGAYLGPDYAAEALHRIGEHIATALAQQQYVKPRATLTAKPTRLASMGPWLFTTENAKRPSPLDCAIRLQ